VANRTTTHQSERETGAAAGAWTNPGVSSDLRTAAAVALKSPAEVVPG